MFEQRSCPLVLGHQQEAPRTPGRFVSSSRVTKSVLSSELGFNLAFTLCVILARFLFPQLHKEMLMSTTQALVKDSCRIM